MHTYDWRDLKRIQTPTWGGKPLLFRFMRGRPDKVGSNRKVGGGQLPLGVREFAPTKHLTNVLNCCCKLYDNKKVESCGLLEHDQCKVKQSSFKFSPHNTDVYDLRMLSSSTPHENVWPSKCLKIPVKVLHTSTKSLLLCQNGQHMEVYPIDTSMHIKYMTWLISFFHSHFVFARIDHLGACQYYVDSYTTMIHPTSCPMFSFISIPIHKWKIDIYQHWSTPTELPTCATDGCKSSYPLCFASL